MDKITYYSSCSTDSVAAVIVKQVGVEALNLWLDITLSLPVDSDHLSSAHLDGERNRSQMSINLYQFIL